MPHVTFAHQNLTVEIPAGANLLEAARRAELYVPAPCGGSGTCGKCRVRIVSSPTPITPADKNAFSEKELSEGWRLACRAVVTKDLSVEYTDGHIGEVILAEAAGIVSCRSLDTAPAGQLGLAVDLGTTTIAATLFDLATGNALGRAACGNPQAIFGADVIARIDHASKSPANLKHMQHRVIGAISTLLEKLLVTNKLSRSNVVTVLVGGNTTMQHMLLAVDPSGIAMAPFTPVFTDAREESAAAAGLKITDGGKLHVMPAISAYVGGDIVGDMLAVGWACPEKRAGAELLIDIGTNGEIAMRVGDEIIACSTAAGPAFEGAKITCGTRAIPGAVNVVDVNGDDIVIETVDAKKTVGICGTGLLDTVAALLELGVIDAGGRMAVSPEGLPTGVAKRLIPHADGGSAVVLDDGVFLTARDVREFQLAKAAISGGVKVLLDLKGLTPDKVDSVLLAGAMGSFLRPASAIRTGLLPCGFKPAQIKAVGNTALEGAGLCLLSKEYRKLAGELSKSCQYVELSGRLDFQMAYTEAMLFD